jgi:hypothetical protein
MKFFKTTYLQSYCQARTFIVFNLAKDYLLSYTI